MPVWSAWCSVPTPEKFIVQLSAVVIRQDGPAQNMSVYVARSAFFEGRWATFGEYLTGKGASPTNQCWFRKTRVIAVSCGIKVSSLHHLVLSQYTRLTDGWTNRQNCDSNIECCITCSHTINLRKLRNLHVTLFRCVVKLFCFSLLLLLLFLSLPLR